MKPRLRLTKAMTEDELLTAITEAATFLGWRWHHIRRSDRALQQGHSGFPDLILAKGKRLYCFELKAKAGTLTVDQQEWLRALPNAYEIRPADLDRVVSALSWEVGLSEAELLGETQPPHHGPRESEVIP